MKQLYALAGFLALFLGGCNLAKAEPTADELRARIGRYQLVEAKPPYPALILDTATGCVEALVVVPEGGVQASFSATRMPDGTMVAPPPAVVPSNRAGSVMRAGIVGQSLEQCKLPSERNVERR